jgi:hypothetical protein
MAYYIFLKSLRSLEEFRKNPHVKIPPKSSCANFQALVNSKIQFLIQKFFFLISARPPPLFFFQPSRGPPPSSQSSPVGQNLSVFRTCPFFIATELVCFLHFKTCPIRPENLSDPAALPTGRCACAQHTWAHSAQAALAYLPKGVFSSTLRTLAETPSLSHVTAMWGPPISSIPFLPRGLTVATRRLRPPRAARPPTSRCHARSSLHVLISPLISLLNPSSSRPAINGLKAITAGHFPLPRPGVPLPGHYKRMRSTPPAITTLTLPSIACFRVRSAHSTERLLRRLFPTVARSCLTLRCPLLQPVRPTAVPSPFFLNRGEVLRTGTPFRPFSGEPPLRR